MIGPFYNALGMWLPLRNIGTDRCVIRHHSWVVLSMEAA